MMKHGLKFYNKFVWILETTVNYDYYLSKKKKKMFTNCRLLVKIRINYQYDVYNVRQYEWKINSLYYLSIA